MDNRTMLIILAFASVAALGYFASTFFISEDKLRERLERQKLDSAPSSGKPQANVSPFLKTLGDMASRPFMPNTREKQSALRRELGRAGIYSPSAIRAVQGAKVILLSAGVMGGYLVGLFLGSILFGFALGGLIGYMAPMIWLRLRIRSNQKQLEFALADAMDLMVVCVEAGLTVDAAMQRVGEELSLVHPGLSREFGITHMETRVGLARQDALRNLGHRTGNQSLTSLAAMLNQADRFGTSIAQALRVHAESLRIARQHKAEEMAAKSTVKMSFPLVLFIFPATFIVALGPVIIRMMNSEFMK